MKSYLNSLIRLLLIRNKKDCTYIQNKITIGRLEICKTKIVSYLMPYIIDKHSFGKSSNKKDFLKKALRMEEFQKYFFTIIFRPKMLILYTYSILST